MEVSAPEVLITTESAVNADTLTRHERRCPMTGGFHPSHRRKMTTSRSENLSDFPEALHDTEYVPLGCASVWLEQRRNDLTDCQFACPLVRRLLGRIPGVRFGLS